MKLKLKNSITVNGMKFSIHLMGKFNAETNLRRVTLMDSAGRLWQAWNPHDSKAMNNLQLVPTFPTTV